MVAQRDRVEQVRRRLEDTGPAACVWQKCGEGSRLRGGSTISAVVGVVVGSECLQVSSSAAASVSKCLPSAAASIFKCLQVLQRVSSTVLSAAASVFKCLQALQRARHRRLQDRPGAGRSAPRAPSGASSGVVFLSSMAAVLFRPSASPFAVPSKASWSQSACCSPFAVCCCVCVCCLLCCSAALLPCCRAVAPHCPPHLPCHCNARTAAPVSTCDTRRSAN